MMSLKNVSTAWAMAAPRRIPYPLPLRKVIPVVSSATAVMSTPNPIK